MTNYKKLPSTPNYLDGKKIFTHWRDMGGGSFTRLAAWCEKNGMKHPDTGRKPTRMGVWVAMWTWALHNMDEARVLFDEVMKQKGVYFTEVEWLSLLHGRARNIYKNGNQFRKFAKEHPIK